eukprot:COSAG06_NODE_54110_length_296_cov_0.903553_1_plen_45_part_10
MHRPVQSWRRVGGLRTDGLVAGLAAGLVAALGCACGSCHKARAYS